MKNSNKDKLNFWNKIIINSIFFKPLMNRIFNTKDRIKKIKLVNFGFFVTDKAALQYLSKIYRYFLD